MSFTTGQNPPQTFDLSEPARLDYATAKGFRFLVAGIGLAVSIFLVLDEVPWSPWYGSFSSDRLFNLVFFGLVIGLCIWFVLSVGPGADSVTIASDGITLSYASGHRVRFAWDDPEFRLTLWKYGTSPVRTAGQVQTDSIVTMIPLRNPIPPTLTDVILSEGRARGMRIDETRIGILGPRRTRFRVRRRS